MLFQCWVCNLVNHISLFIVQVLLEHQPAQAPPHVLKWLSLGYLWRLLLQVHHLLVATSHPAGGVLTEARNSNWTIQKFGATVLSFVMVAGINKYSAPFFSLLFALCIIMEY